MSDKTGIEWTDATWNPIRGCTPVSEGCQNCYAATVANRFSEPGQPYEGLARNGKWTGKIMLVENHVADPLKWEKPRRIFVNSMSDLFHESVPENFIDTIFNIMAITPRHTYQILTKRPERMLAYLGGLLGKHVQGLGSFTFPLPNVWLGVSVENQKAADTRIPLLLKTPAAVRFLSCEPLLGPVDLRPWLVCTGCADETGPYKDAPRGVSDRDVHHCQNPRLSWVIVGGESGNGARPMHPDWARSLRDHCRAAWVPFFFKQWGEWVKYIDRDKEDSDWRENYAGMAASKSFRVLNLEGGIGFHGERVHVMQRIGKKAAGRELDGQTWDQMPAPYGEFTSVRL